MAVKQVCPPMTFPSFDSLFSQLNGLNLSFDPSWPSLPTMPSPLLPDIQFPDWQKVNLAFNISANQLLKWFEAIIGKLSSFLGSVFTFPDIPYINLKLPDLFNFGSGPDFDWDALFAKIPKLSLPTLPDPLLGDINWPAFENLAKYQALILNYMSSLMDSLIGLLNSVISKLNLKPFELGLSMPTLPDPLLPFDFESLLNFNMPSLPTLPDPLFGNFHNPDMELFERAKNYFLHLVSLIGKTIDDFVASIASWIGGWTPPLICFGVPINVET